MEWVWTWKISMEGCKQELKGTREKKTGQLDGKEKSTKGYSRQLTGTVFANCGFGLIQTTYSTASKWLLDVFSCM